MLQNPLTKLFGSRNQRLLKKLSRTVDQINSLETQYAELGDEQLRGKTEEFRQRLQNGGTLDSLLVESFAVVREASKRTLGLRHFDMQLIGGMVLHSGKIAEMRTGEGKTLVATLPAYLNALSGKSVHIVTVNDYLASRDAGWMGKIYNFLGLSVGVIVSGQEPQAKRQAYASDIVYGTNNEYGFDYLRDNMAFSGEDRFQRGLGFAVVDEVDSILIDEARTPLIISGPAEGGTDLYLKINQVVPKLERAEAPVSPEGVEPPGDFTIDEKSKQVYLTEQGHEHAERLLTEAGLLDKGGSLYDVTNIGLVHHLYAALRARNLFQRDVDYIVSNDGQVVIIDEFTGRMMSGRRWSDGLHQAIEAKEGVAIQQENQTLASITFQNYFRLYENLSGMTGTADTEAPEFQQIYGLEVVVIPTNQPMIRNDMPDLVFRTAHEKYDAILEGVKACLDNQQPVLVGTASIETSEYLSGLLRKAGIEHQVLNAKHHEREASIIADAGRPGNVTIATNMAGRGTDIVLGGNLEMELASADEAQHSQIQTDWKLRHQQVLEAGGLHVLGTERNESRRVDNQLRGRCGRQGDPGSSQFYLSLEDSLMRIFGSERVSTLMQKLGMEEGESIEHPWVSKAIENAQRKVEGHNFDMRKQLLEYDDVANEQRKVVYEQRNTLMEVEDISENINVSRHEVVNSVIDNTIPQQSLEEQWDVPALEKELEKEFGTQMPVSQWLEKDDNLHEENLREKIEQTIVDSYREKEAVVGSQGMRHFEKAVMLRVLDEQWKEHLANMDHLRQGIGLRGYAQKNPKQEYKRESFEMFTLMLDNVKQEVISILSRFQIQTEQQVQRMEEQKRQEQAEQQMQFLHPEAAAQTAREAEAQAAAVGEGEGQSAEPVPEQPYVRQSRKIGRNEPCPCGSGKKYKQCHGRLA